MNMFVGHVDELDGELYVILPANMIACLGWGDGDEISLRIKGDQQIVIERVATFAETLAREGRIVCPEDGKGD